MPGSSQSLERDLRLYVVLDPDHLDANLMWITRSALAGGATAIQLRCKSHTDREFFTMGSNLASVCADAGALFIINDRVDIALACGANGVHLGVDDLPLPAARSIAPADFIIGYSPESGIQARKARQDGASYLGVGPVFGTSSKADAGPAIGIEILERRVQIAGVPVIGIGGISAANASHVLASGAVGVAVMSAVTSSSDPEVACRNIASALNRVDL